MEFTGQWFTPSPHQGRASISNIPFLLFQLFYFSCLILALFVGTGVFSNLYYGTGREGNTSECYLERVMIDKLIDIEGLVNIQNVHVIDFPVDRRV